MLSSIAAAVVAASPGLYAWWSSRELLRRLDDPLLPDLLLRRSRRVRWALGLAIGVGLVAASDHVAWLLAAALFGVAIGVFPSRRRIFGETWSLGAYLVHVARFYLGVYGGLLLLAFLPHWMRAAGPFGMGVGVTAGLLVVAYGLVASRLLPVWLRARELVRSELEAPFDAILSRARAPRPRILVADAPGGTWINAFALPSVARPAVLFTRGLLDALEPAEVSAIFAHEIAHLEHHRPRRLLAAHFVTLLLVGLAVFLWAGPYRASLRGLEWAWTIAILLAGSARAGRRSRHEAESDLRAVELCGDPEALVRGLTKLYLLARVPRRWSEGIEARASHPSLARRIRAIRAASPAGRRVGLEPRLFLASDGTGRAVVLDAERLHWLAGVPEGSRQPLVDAAERRSLPYGELRELRLEPGGAVPALVFKESAGVTRRMAVAASEAPRLQETLDAIDDRLGYRTPEPGGPARLASLVLLLLSISQSWPLAALAGLALWLPVPSTLAGLGAAGLTAAALELARPVGSRLTVTSFHVALVALAALASLVLAARRYRGENPPPRAASAASVLVPLSVAALALPAALHVATSTIPVMHAHLWARSHPGVPIGLMGAAAALATLRSGKARAGATLPLVAAAAVLALGSVAARERFSSDLFRHVAAPLGERSAELVARRELEMPGAVSTLALSPSGERVAARTFLVEGRAYDEVEELDFRVETPSGELALVPALDLEWWDEGRLMLVALDEGRAVLRLASLTDSAEGEELELPPLLDLDLQVEPESGLWQISGRTPDDRELVVLRGRAGEASYESLRYGYSEETGTRPEAVSAEGTGLEVEYSLPSLAASFYGVEAYRLLALRIGLRSPGAAPAWLGATALQADCRQGPPSESRFLCLVREDERTSFWSLDPGRRAWTAMGAVSPSMYSVPGGESSRHVLLGAGGGPVLADLERGLAFTTKLPRAATSASSRAIPALLYRQGPVADVMAAAWRGRTLAVASSWDPREETSRVTLYEVREAEDEGAP